MTITNFYDVTYDKMMHIPLNLRDATDFRSCDESRVVLFFRVWL